MNSDAMLPPALSSSLDVVNKQFLPVEIVFEECGCDVARQPQHSRA